MLLIFSIQGCLKLLEVAGDRQQSKARLLVDIACGSMAWIASCFNHSNGHSSVFHPIQRESCQVSVASLTAQTASTAFC